MNDKIKWLWWDIQHYGEILNQIDKSDYDNFYTDQTHKYQDEIYEPVMLNVDTLGVSIGLIVSIIVALIKAKTLNRNFFSIWLCVFVTIGAVAASILAIATIVEYGIINESMLCLIGAIMCWISAVTMWRSEYENKQKHS